MRGKWYFRKVENLLVRLLGWHATVLHGDPTVADRWEWLKKHLKAGPLKTLEVGCGTGAMTLFAARLGNQSLGLSFNDRNNQVALQRASLLKLRNVFFKTADLRSLENLGLGTDVFDQVICLETIEHLLEDQKLLDNLSALLKPKGKLLLTTPYKGHFPLIGEAQDPEYRSAVEDGGHVRFGYTSEEMRSLCEKAGLSIESEEYVSGYVSQKLYTLFCKMDAWFPHRFVWLVTLPLRPLRKLDRWVTQALGYPGLSLAVVAVKR